MKGILAIVVATLCFSSVAVAGDTATSETIEKMDKAATQAGKAAEQATMNAEVGKKDGRNSRQAKRHEGS